MSTALLEQAITKLNGQADPAAPVLKAGVFGPSQAADSQPGHLVPHKQTGQETENQPAAAAAAAAAAADESAALPEPQRQQSLASAPVQPCSATQAASVWEMPDPEPPGGAPPHTQISTQEEPSNGDVLSSPKARAEHTPAEGKCTERSVQVHLGPISSDSVDAQLSGRSVTEPTAHESSQGDRPAAGSSVQHPLPSRRVTWPDMQGHDLTSVREFEPSEPGEYDIGFGGWDNKRSCCSIM